MSPEIVAVIAIEEKRRETDLRVAQLPGLDAFHLIVEPPAKRHSVSPSHPQLAGDAMAHVRSRR